MAQIYRKKNSFLYYKTRQYTYNRIASLFCNEDNFSPLLKEAIRQKKEIISGLITSIDESQSLYQGPLLKDECVRDIEVMGFPDFTDPLLKIGNHIQACTDGKLWNKYFGTQAMEVMNKNLMAVVILQECGQVLHRFKQGEFIVVNPYEERFVHAARIHFKTWKFMDGLFSPEELHVLLHAYISHRRRRLFEFEYTFPLTHNLHHGEWDAFEMEQRDVMRMESESSNAWTWGGFIAQKFYIDTEEDNVRWFATRMRKKYVLGEKDHCLVIYSTSTTNINANEEDSSFVSWWASGLQAPCPNCRAYNKMMKEEFASDPPSRRRVVRPMECGCLDITRNLPFFKYKHHNT